MDENSDMIHLMAPRQYRREISPDEELRINFSEQLSRLRPGQRIIIDHDRLRKLWPEQTEEELQATFSTNDLKKLVRLTATAHDCDHVFSGDVDVAFVKNSD